jgi:arylsulfatase A-like enzyme
MIRWPGHIKSGEVSNELFSGLDWFPTLLAAAGDTDIKQRLLKGASIGGKTFKVHLDGYNQLPYLTGQQERGARDEFFYFDDDGRLVAMRFDYLQPGATTRTAWKVVFCEQRAPGQLEIWSNPFTCLRLPKLENLRWILTSTRRSQASATRNGGLTMPISRPRLSGGQQSFCRPSSNIRLASLRPASRSIRWKTA